jgi:hypothetical protein
LSIDAQRLLLHAMETFSELRAERINQALIRAQRAAIVDARALGYEMEALGDEMEELFDLAQTAEPRQQSSLEAMLFASASQVDHPH